MNAVHVSCLLNPITVAGGTRAVLLDALVPASGRRPQHGVTPERVGEKIVRLAGGALFGGLDRDTLAAIGIDVDAVRTRIETSFGPGALIQAGQAAPRGPAWPG